MTKIRKNVHKGTIVSDFICTNCSNLAKLPETMGVDSKKYSKKQAYCYICGKETVHINLKNKEMTEKSLEFMIDRNKEEEKTYKLLQKTRKGYHDGR